MSIEENKALVHRIYDELYGQRKLDLADEIYAPTAVAHEVNSPEQPVPLSPEEVRSHFQQQLEATPDMRIVVEDMVAEGDRVAYRWRMTGTQIGAMPGGVAGTGKPFNVTGQSTVRIENGKVVELWSVYDRLGMFIQLGIIQG